MFRKLMFVCLVLLLAACQAPAAPAPTATPFPEIFTGNPVVNGNELLINCKGTGKLTIILENGLDYGSWTDLRNFSNITRSCSYSRAGMTSTVNGPRTTLDQVKDLHQLLTQIGVPGPYILVGHSIAGYNLLVYFEQYPKDIVGLVCADCRYPAVSELFLEKIKTQYAKEPNLTDILNEAIEKYPLLEIKNSDTWKSFREKLDIFGSAKQVMNIKTLGDIPLIVLVASDHLLGINKTNDPLFASSWDAASLKLSQLSSQGRLEVVPNTNHLSLTKSSAVIKAVQEVFDKVKKP